MSLETLSFSEAFRDVTGGNHKVKTNEYLTQGKFPIVDQGKELIAGYVDDEEMLCKANKPSIIFGDHTKIIKFIDFDFVLGADGVKVLQPCEKLYPKYAYHYLKTVKFPENTGYMRHFKYLKLASIPIPPLDEQKRIADILDKAEEIRLESGKIINLKDNIIQGLFFEMFGDPVLNPKGWDKVTVKEIATIVRGSSPRPKGDPRYYGEGIPRLMVADLTRDGMYVTPSIDSLTIEGAKKSRSMMKGDLVMAVSGRPGLPAILNIDCCIHDGFAGFRELSQNFNNIYLYYYFKLYISQVNKRSVGAIFKNITTSDIKNTEVFDVCLEHQNQFAEIALKVTSLDYSTLHNQVLNLEKSISQEMSS